MLQKERNTSRATKKIEIKIKSKTKESMSFCMSHRGMMVSVLFNQPSTYMRNIILFELIYKFYSLLLPLLSLVVANTLFYLPLT